VVSSAGSRRLLKSLIALGLGLQACGGADHGADGEENVSVRRAPAAAAAAPDGQPWNFVVLLTDDQRWDTVSVMPILQERMIAEGVNFTNAYVSVPLCCPDRASILSGGFLAQNTGVLTNLPPNGGFQVFSDTDSMAVRLQEIGYRTGLVGKYMNGYDYASNYVAPGWDMFYAKDALRIEEFMLTQAFSFIENYKNEPFFLYLAPANPHFPATPMPQDRNLFSDFVYRERGFGETDLADKPSWVRFTQADHGPDATSAAGEDEFHRNQMRSLQAVDRVLGQLLDKLEAEGVLDHTIFFFTSDNGYMWGEHGLWAKRWPYEESARVPFVVRVPGLAPREEAALTATNLDIPSTIWSLVGIDRGNDGLNLMPLLGDTTTTWPTTLFIEHFGSGFPSQGNEVWAALRTTGGDGDWKYVEYATGEKELYDLASDPFELESKHNDPTCATIRTQFAGQLAGQKGLAVTSLARTVTAKVGTAFNHQLVAWGGDGSYTWSVISGSLPPGLSLDASTGAITGTPTSSGSYTFRVQVEDTKLAKYLNRGQRFVHEIVATVAPGAPPPPPPTDTDGDGVADTSDNCTTKANPDQRDSNGDGFGNRCDGDLNGDKLTNKSDFDLLKPQLGKTTYPDGDFDGSGKVDQGDFTIFNQELFGKAPGPSALAQ